jgi:hypothetical protein
MSLLTRIFNYLARNGIIGNDLKVEHDLEVGNDLIVRK